TRFSRDWSSDVCSSDLAEKNDNAELRKSNIDMNTMLASSRKLLIPLIVLALLVFLGLSLGHKDQAPDVTFTTLQGEEITMSELQGKVVLVNFWATDCPGCIAEMPQLIETYH